MSHQRRLSRAIKCRGSQMGQMILKLFTLFRSIFLFLWHIIWNNMLSVDLPNSLALIVNIFILLCCSPGFDFRAIFVLIYDCKWNSNKLKWKHFHLRDSLPGCQGVKCSAYEFLTKLNSVLLPGDISFKTTLVCRYGNIVTPGDWKSFVLLALLTHSALILGEKIFIFN